MSRTMKAAVVREFGKPLTIEEVAIPQPGPGQIQVKIEASGVCHTDLHAAEGDWPVKPGPAPKVAGTLRTGPLLISETYDGATPYEGALQARRTFPGSSLVEGVGGHTHSSSLSGIACTDDTVADYLLTGALPERTAGDRSDRQYPPLPPPSPTGG